MKQHWQNLKISDIFNILGEDSNLTRDFIHKTTGEFPVYSGQIDSPAGYINDYKYDEELLIWTTYGNAGILKWVNGKFSIGRNAAGLRLKEEYVGKINLRWFKYIFQDLILNYRIVEKGQGRLPHTIMGKIEVKIPITEDGNIDIVTQENVLEKYEKLEKLKSDIECLIMDVSEWSIDIDIQGNLLETELSNDKYFTIEMGKRVLKEDILNSKGNIPVYSSNVCEIFGYIDNSNLSSFDKVSILWGIDGNFTLEIKRPNEVFATTDHCGRLIINNANIVPEYILYQLIIIGSKYGFDRNFRPSKDKMEKVVINLPINSNHEIDTNKQNDIVSKIYTFMKIKNNLLEELEAIKSLNVVY